MLTCVCIFSSSFETYFVCFIVHVPDTHTQPVRGVRTARMKPGRPASGLQAVGGPPPRGRGPAEPGCSPERRLRSGARLPAARRQRPSPSASRTLVKSQFPFHTWPRSIGVNPHKPRFPIFRAKV